MLRAFALFKPLPLPHRNMPFKLLLMYLCIKLTSEQAALPRQPPPATGSSYQGSPTLSPHGHSPDRPLLFSRYYEFFDRLKRENRPSEPDPASAEQQGSSRDSDYSAHFGQLFNPNIHGAQSQFKRDTPTSSEEMAVQQLQLLMQFTNGLILTEALATNQTNISQIVTDFMIIEQMKDFPDWITVVNSKEIDAATGLRIEKSFEKLGSLWNLIENGLVDPVDVELISTGIVIIENFESIDRTVESVKKFEEMGKKFKKIVSIKYSQLESPLKSLIKLPKILNAFRNVSDPQSALESVQDGIEIVKNFGQLQTFQHLSLAKKACEPMKNPHDRMDCLTYLKDGFLNLTFPSDDKMRSLLDGIRVIDLLGTQTTSVANWETVVNSVADFSFTGSRWEAVSHFMKQKKDAIEHSKKLRMMLAKLETLKGSAESLSRMETILSYLEPIHDIAREFQKIYNDGSLPSSSQSNNPCLSFSKSFQGLPNGLSSVDVSSNKVGQAHELPSEYLRSKIDERATVLRDWVYKFAPIVESADAFRSIPYFLEIVNELKKIVSSGIPSNLASNLTIIEGYYDQIPDIESVKTSFQNVHQMIVDFNSTNWKKDIVDVVNKYAGGFDRGNLETAFKILSPLPPFIQFAIKVKNVVAPFSNDLVDLSLFADSFKNISSEMDNGLKVTNNLQDAIDEVKYSYVKMLDVTADIGKVKNNLPNSGKLPSMPELQENDYNETHILKNVEKSDDLCVGMTDLADKAKNIVTDFVLKAQSLSTASSLTPKPVKPDEVESTKSIITELSKKREINNKIEESDAISLMMNGTPFGNDVLDKMHGGVTRYGELVGGQVSLKKWKEVVDKNGASIKKRQVDEKALIGRIEKLMDGVEPIKMADGEELGIYSGLKSITAYNDKLKKVKEAVEILKPSGDLNTVENDLSSLLNNPSTSNETRPHIVLVHKSVVSLKSDLADKVGDLIISLSTLASSLAFVNCSKYPDDPKCKAAGFGSTGTNSGFAEHAEPISIWVYIGIGIGVVLFLGGGGFVIYRLQVKMKEKEHDVEELARDKNVLNKKVEEQQKDASAKSREHKHEITAVEKQHEEELQEKENMKKELQEKVEKQEAEKKELEENLKKQKEENERKEEELANMRQEREDNDVKMEEHEREYFRQEAEIKKIEKAGKKVPKQKRIDLENLKKKTLSGFEVEKNATRFTVDRGWFGSAVVVKNEDPNIRYIEHHVNQMSGMKALERPEPEACPSEIMDDNMRYPNRALYAKNRVKLPGDDKKVLVHASRITCFKEEKWIGMQAPNTSNNEPLYKMAFQENLAAILQLCPDNESDKYPLINYRVNGKHGEFTVNQLTVTKENQMTTTKLQVTDKKGKNIEIMHYLYEAWPDKEAPQTPDDIVKVIMQLREVAKKNYVAVHCQAGSGRTGTVLCIAYTISLVKQFKPPIQNKRMFDIVEIMRDERSEAVQSYVQLAFFELSMGYFYTLLPESVHTEICKAKYKRLLSLYKTNYKTFIVKQGLNHRNEKEFREKVLRRVRAKKEDGDKTQVDEGK